MKKHFIYKYGLLLSVLIAIGCGSCQKDNYVQYDAGYASLRFIYAAEGNDSIVYSFALHPDKQEDTVEIPFKLVGLAVGQDREIGVEVVKEETTAQENDHFIIERSELAADSIKGILKVKVKKTPELENHNLVATFRLCGNENFAAAPVNENTYKIVLTNYLAEPTGWPFGEYSRIKHQFVIQILGIATDYDKWSTSETIYYTGIMINALYEYNKAHPGEPLTDENGLAVTF